MVVFSDFKMSRDEEVVAYFKVQFWIFMEGLRKRTGNLS